LRRIKPSPPTTKKNTANEKGGDGTDRDDDDAEAVVWEELNDDHVIQRIVWRCMKNVYKLSEKRKREKAERKQKSKDGTEADPTEAEVGARQGGRKVPQLPVAAASPASAVHEEHADADDDEQRKNKQK